MHPRGALRSRTGSLILNDVYSEGTVGHFFRASKIHGSTPLAPRTWKLKLESQNRALLRRQEWKCKADCEAGSSDQKSLRDWK
jgi:hypothetical protein